MPVTVDCVSYVALRARLTPITYPGGKSGLGIPENVVTLCQTCHMAYDQSTQREILKNEIADYLRSKYPRWDDMRLTYRKGD